MEYIVPLGVSAAVPSAGRHFASVAYVAEQYVVLFDCGEGTQFRLLDAGIRLSRIQVIAITHLHGDHYLGLPGLLSTMAMQQRQDPLTVVCPEPLEELIYSMPGIGRDRGPFEVRFVGIAPDFTSGRVLQWDRGGQTGFSLDAAALDHTIEAYGYRLRANDRPGHLDVDAARALGVEGHEAFRALKSGTAVRVSAGELVQPEQVVSAPTPGPSVAYVSDSRPCPGAVQVSRGVDLLYHEATFADSESERAQRTGHSTARQAAEIAAQASVGKLVLGHFSARYPDASVLADEARTVFDKSYAAEELQRYYLVAP